MSTRQNSQQLNLNFSRMNRSSAVEIAHWRYPPPYDIYNLNPGEETIAYASNPGNYFYVIQDDDGRVVGFCSFGQDARVPGGDYNLEALDIGMGIHPELTGQGFGIIFAAEVVKYGISLFTPRWLRVTIAAFNQRAQRVWARIGFITVQDFIHPESGRAFVVMVNGD